MGKAVHYLDVDIHHNDGYLRTKVYRPHLIEQYVLPYLTAYLFDEYTARIRRHVIRTIQLCSHIEDFYDEHSFACSIYLWNHFPANSIVDCVQEIFHKFDSSKLYHQYDQNDYEPLRRWLRNNNTQLSDLLLVNNSNKRSYHDDSNTATSVKRTKS